jgi:hypothetical protein
MEYTVTEAKCKDDTAEGVLSSGFYFRFLPSTQQNVALTVTARVPDRFGAVGTASEVISLSPNRPPCIEATDPSFADPTAIVLHTEERRFQATSVSEDVLEGLTYTWQVQDDGQTGFSTLAGQAGQSLELPSGFRPPGSTIYLRLIVEESGGAAPSCKPEDRTCPLDGNPALPKGCYQWVTWKVVFQ